MTTYIALMNYTDAGMKNIRQSPARLDEGKALLEEMGGSFKEFFLTMGGHDIVLIYDAPDDAVSARFTLLLGARGNVRATTLKAFPENAFRELIHTLG